MKQITLNLLFLFFTANIFTQCLLDYDDWDVVFEDEFDDYTSIGELSDNYYLSYPWGLTISGNNERQLYQSDQFELDGENLIIKADHISPPQYYTIPGELTGDYYDYHSGMLRIKNPLSPPSCDFVSNGFKYGLFEMRCKMPDNTTIDFWPAFWLYNGPSEIDIFEFHSRTWNETLGISEPNTKHFSTNLIDHTSCSSGICTTCTESYDKISTPTLSSGFHTFSLVWIPPVGTNPYPTITFFIDGKELRTVSNSFVPNCAMEVFINLAVGSNCCAAPTPNDEFTIDYIKIYEKSEYSDTYKSEFAWMSAPLSYSFNPNWVVSSAANSLCINANSTRVFYRGLEDKANQFRWDVPSQTWKHSWLEGMDAPDDHDINGDVAVGENDEVFYRGPDGFIQTYYRVSGAWTHAWIDPGASSGKKISNQPNSLSIGASNELFYRGNDNYIHQYYKSGTTWVHKKLQSSVPWEQQCSGDVEVNADNSKVFYKGNDGYIHFYKKSGTSWTHYWIESSTADFSTKISSSANSLVISSIGDIFYRGSSDNKLHKYTYNSTTDSYSHSVINSGPFGTPTAHLINGTMKITNDDRIIYLGNDQKIQYLEKPSIFWEHGEISNYYLYDPLIYNYFDVAKVDGKIFYGDGNNHVFSYYWTTCEQLDNECSEQTVNVYKLKENSFNISIVPNPASYFIKVIGIDINIVEEVRLYDINGNFIKIFKIGNTEGILDIHELNQGMYILSIIYNNDTLNLRFIKS